MNEFLEQFVIESKELVGEATDGLLQLEQSPQDSDCLDRVFRAFHTLKGGAGIVEFAAMERAVHAAEEVLSEARTGQAPLTAQLVGECLGCLDHILEWLDVVEQTGGWPPESERQAEALVLRLAAASNVDQIRQEPQSGDAPNAWVTTLLDRHPEVRVRAKAAVRYKPHPECFYQGEDPLARVGALARLLALHAAPIAPWPSLSELDPYHCNLVLMALTESSETDVAAHMQGALGECDIVAIGSLGDLGGGGSLPQRVRDVLDAQIALLCESNPLNLAGRVASAGLTAVHAMRHCGRSQDAQILARATDESIEEHSPRVLQAAIGRVLAAEVAIAATASESPQRAELVNRTLRVDAERIEALVRLTGELTVAKNALGHTVKQAADTANSLAAVLAERQGVFDRLVEDLQRAVLALRVMPLRSVLQRFPRVVRDLSSSLGKPIQLNIEGDDTEADKTIVEMLFEPLLHILRNAIDHGIEAPTLRVERGKPLVATVRIRATRDADRVLVEVSDDGAGIDVARIREVAAKRGLATRKELDEMPPEQIIDFIFAAGFSTVAEVTEISGRGVGMDAVRSAVERVGGRVSIESQPGNGTVVRFSLPFSVMVTHVMTVEAGGQVFGIPLDVLIETVRIPTDAIANLGAARVVVLHERTIPVLELARILDAGPEGNLEARTEALLVIAAVSGQHIGIRVDRLGERLEVILRPLEGLLAGTPGIAGTTLLGDGRVLLVLNVAEMLI